MFGVGVDGGQPVVAVAERSGLADHDDVAAGRAGHRKRHRQHDNDRLDEALELGGQDEVDECQSQ